MIDLEALIQNETIADVAYSLARSGGDNVFSYIRLDRLYSQYKPSVHETREFRDAIRQLVDKQILDMSPQMGLSRGINWKCHSVVRIKNMALSNQFLRYFELFNLR